MIFQWHGNFKKRRLSAGMVPKPGRHIKVLGMIEMVKSVWAVLKENRRITCQVITVLTTIS